MRFAVAIVAYVISGGGLYSASAFTINELQSPLTGKFLERRVTLRYGADWVASCGGLVKIHTGTDVGATAGERVFAADRGVVKIARRDSQWGGYVTLEHASAFTTVYWHVIPDAALREGTTIERGAFIGVIADGPSFGFGTHLHFGVRIGPYSNTSNRGALPQQRCEGDPSFAEGSFVDPMSLRYANSPLEVQPIQNTCTNLVNRSTAVPSGYGSPVNLFANDRNLLFEAVCRGGDKVEIHAGHNYPQQYTYRYGYRWTGQQWQRFEFTGAARRGEWMVGQATAELDRRQLNASGNNWIVGYSCWLLPTGQWRCGCANTACAGGIWQVQGFRLEPQNAVGSWNAVAGTWRGNVLQPGAPRYTTTFRVDATGPGARCGTVDYPELRCGGELRDCRMSDGAYLFTEVLSYGRLQCVDNGTISVRPRGNQLDWQVFFPDGRFGASAVLSRQ